MWLGLHDSEEVRQFIIYIYVGLLGLYQGLATAKMGLGLVLADKDRFHIKVNSVRVPMYIYRERVREIEPTLTHTIHYTHILT